MRLYRSWLVTAAIVAVPIFALAQRGNLTNQQAATQDAAVDFGVFPTAPLGPAPCVQAPAAAIGGPADPCAYKLHHLTPEEVFIKKEGEVTFQFHGGGHALAIYEVSKDTTRAQVGQFLCLPDPTTDPGGIADPTQQKCNGAAAGGIANAAAPHEIRDGHSDVVIEVQQNVTNAHPDNRVWSPDDRLMSAGGRQFLNGGTVAAGPTSDGQLITYRFLKNGRYLVICMNRSHFLNDWMFGFVNVQ